MSIFLAVIAFFMAFGALWFTSEIARRLDLRGKAAIKPDIAPVLESLRRAEKQIRDLAHGLDAAERQIQALNAQSGNLEKDIQTREEGATNPEMPLSTLDILRGAQRFYPSETYKN